MTFFTLAVSVQTITLKRVAVANFELIINING